MEQSQIFEGTWEDIKRHEQELSGRWLKVTVEARQEQSDRSTQKTVVTDEQAQTLTKPLYGRGMFKGKLGGTEALLRQKREDINREEQSF